MEIIKTINNWLHILSATLSLILGFYMIIDQKGTEKHIKIGRIYFWLMLINCITSLFILNVSGKWFFPHWLGVATIIILIPSYLITFKKSYKHWLKFHIIGFVLSYYMLVGGAINELFLHVNSLRPFLIKGSSIVGISHFVTQLIFIFLIGFFLWKSRKTNTN